MNVSSQAFDQPELSQLLLAQLTGGLSSQQHHRLEALLESNTAARAVYLDYMHDAAVMRQVLLAEEADDSDIAPHDTWSLWTAAYDLLIQPIALSMLVSGLLITTALLSLALIAMPKWQPTGDTGRPKFVATVVRTSGARWSEDSGIAGNRVTDLLAGDQIELLAGLAELRFASGAVVLLEGPTRFSPQEDNAGQLLRGKLTANVPGKAVGFTIDTPRVRIVDLGTEFGVETDAAGNTFVAVIEGEIELRAGGGAASRQGAVRATAGQSLQFDASGIRRTDQTEVARQFKRRLPGVAARRPNSPPASIPFVGEELNLAAFRSTSVAKQYDADGDHVYGTAGYFFFNIGSQPPRRNEDFTSRSQVKLPRFVSAIRPLNGTSSAGGYGYLRIDDPTAKTAETVPDIESGAAALPLAQVSLMQEQSLMAIVLGEAIPPQGFRIGILTDNSRARNMPAAIRLHGAGGDSGPVRIDGDPNEQGDWFFFDVTGTLPGDALTISIDNRGTELAGKTLGGLVFDVPPQVGGR